MAETKYPKRKQIRLPNYDYAQPGSYFVTICTNEKQKLFGSIAIRSTEAGAECDFSEYGRKVDAILSQMPSVDVYTVMPNHIHAIFVIEQNDMTSLPSLVRYFKRSAIKQCGAELWQRGYYEHIIRDEADYMCKCKYIADNPGKWAEDEYFTR